MRTNFRRITSAALASFLLALSTVNVSAKSVESCEVMADGIELVAEEQSASEYENMISEMQLISEEETVDDNGNITIDRIYSDGISLLASDLKGSATYTHEKELVFSDREDSLLYSVTGTFTWNGDDGTASVKNAKYYHGSISDKCTVSNEEKEAKSNQGSNFFLGHKYAYVKYSFTFTGMFGNARDASVYLEVNAVGTITTK